MSNTIQSRQYTARQAALFQQRPGELIDAVERLEAAVEGSYSRAVHALYEQGRIHSEVGLVVGTAAAGAVAAIAAGVRVLLGSTARPTTAPELTVEPDEYQTDDWLRWAGEANDALKNGAVIERRASPAASRWRVERLSALQAAFGFTIQDLAIVLAITRPQLYKWLDAANDVKLQEASRVRLAAIERIAKEWTSRSNAPLGSLSREPLNAGATLFQMLSAEAVDEGRVIAAFDELVAKLKAAPMTRSQRLREAGFTRRPSVRSLPADE